MKRKVLHYPELPYYLTVEAIFDEENDEVKVEVHSKFHVEKTIKLSTSYSFKYVCDCKSNFRGDILLQVIKIYGLKAAPLKYE